MKLVGQMIDFTKTDASKVNATVTIKEWYELGEKQYQVLCSVIKTDTTEDMGIIPIVVLSTLDDLERNALNQFKSNMASPDMDIIE